MDIVALFDTFWLLFRKPLLALFFIPWRKRAGVWGFVSQSMTVDFQQNNANKGQRTKAGAVRGQQGS